MGIRIVRTEELKDKHQTTIEKKADFILIAETDGGEKFILHLECQSLDEQGMVYRMQEYYGLLRRKYRLPVKQFVLYLGQKPSKMRTQLTLEEVLQRQEHRCPCFKRISALYTFTSIQTRVHCIPCKVCNGPIPPFSCLASFYKGPFPVTTWPAYLYKAPFPVCNRHCKPLQCLLQRVLVPLQSRHPTNTALPARPVW